MASIVLLISLVVVTAAGFGGHSILFTRMGKTAVQTGFGHLVLDLRMDAIRASYDNLDDMVRAVLSEYKGTLSLRDIRRRQYSLSRVMSRLEALWAVVHPDGSSAPLIDDSNDFLTALDSAVDRLATTTTTTTAAPTRNKRTIVQAAQSVLHLAAFGTSLYNRRQLTAIQKAAKSTAHRSGHHGTDGWQQLPSDPQPHYLRRQHPPSGVGRGAIHHECDSSGLAHEFER